MAVWYPVIQESLDYSMSTGSSVRIRECDQCLGQGTSNAVQVTRKEDGFLFYCFRCNKAGFIHDKGASPREVQEVIKNAQKDPVNNRPEVVALPSDFTHQVPPKGMVQLLDLGITAEDCEWFDVGWSPSRERIIVPIYKYMQSNTMGKTWAKKLIGVVGRKVDDPSGTDGKDDKKPKWWSQRQRDIKHPRFVGLPKTILYPKQVVIVEDVFSAIRISTTGRLALALLTTYLPYEIYPILQGWDVRLWLDNDAYTKSVKYQASLGQAGVTAKTILTTLDPKAYSNDDINEVLNKGGL